jgi:hypothetical protein
LKGEKGDRGDKGDTGNAFTYDMFTAEQLAALTGPAGPKGDDGATGPTGPAGPKGDTGATGPTGPAGPQGDTGPAGADGKAGKDGVSVTHSWNGTTLTVTSASGTSSADLRGPKGDTGPQGDTGPAGPKGDKGDPGSGASSWNDLTDKPFGESYGDTLTWDGNTEGHVFVDPIGDGMTMVLVKVSDAIPTKQDFSAGAITENSNGVISDNTAQSNIGVIQNSFTEDGFVFMMEYAVVPYDNYVFDGVALPEAGVYFVIMGGVKTLSLTIPGYTGFPVVKTIDPKYLPESDIVNMVLNALPAAEGGSY